MPSADYFGTPHYYTLLGYLALFHEIGLDYTFSAFASEGGNFGLFTSHEMMKRLNAKIYAEAKRLGVKWILGGECGHMWRVLHQYMDTMNGPADFLEVPVSPITGTRFENARSTKMVHICEFTADLIHNGKLKLDPSPQRPAGTSPSTIPAIRRAPWDCWKSRATSCATSATSSTKCPRTPSASRPSAAAAAPVWAPTRISRCACAAAFRAPTPSSTCRKSTA